MCLTVFICLSTDADSFQFRDTPIQQIYIRPPNGVRASGGRRGKSNGLLPSEKIKDSFDTKIIVIQAQPALSTPLPEKPRMSINKRKAKFHVASGAYPVYYAIARSNGSFKGNPIWLLTSQ